MTGGYRHHRIHHGHFPKPATIRRTYHNSSRKGVSARRHNNACFASRAEFRRANRRKTPRSCARPQHGPDRRPRSSFFNSSPSYSYTLTSYHPNDGDRHGERNDDDRDRPPPPPPPIHPRGDLPLLRIRCHFSDHAGQCERHCRRNCSGHFPYTVVRKHTTLTFRTDVYMEAFLVDERDTLISQPWPPHYRAAAGAILNRRVLELLCDPCPDNPRRGHTWPLRSILDRTVYVTKGMNLQERSQCAVLSRYLYDITDGIIDSQVPKDELVSVGLLLWATKSPRQHLFRLVSIFTNSKLHRNKWGLELPGITRTKETYVPEARSSGKRRQDSSDPSFGSSPHFTSASSSSSDPPPPPRPRFNDRRQSRGKASSSNSVDPPPPQEPMVMDKGLSRGEASSSNSVHPPPASGSTPPVSSGSIPSILNQIPTFPPGVDPCKDAVAIPRSKVFKLLETPSAKHKHSYEYWRSIAAILGHCMDSTNPAKCKFLATYLHACTGVDHLSPNNEDAIEHTACVELTAWADLPCNKYLLTSFQFHATQTPASLLDHHPGDNYYLSLASHYLATSPPSPPNTQFDGRALVQRSLPRLIDLSIFGNTYMPSNFDPSPGAGAVLRDSVLQLLVRPRAPNNPWWSISDLLEELLHLPTSSESKTAEVLDNYLRALARLGDARPTGDHQILCAGLLTWARLPNYRHLVVTFEPGDVRGATLPPVTDVGEKYYFRLPSPTPRSNQDRPPAHPDPYPAVNKLIGEIVTDLLCFQGPTAQDSYTVSELLGRLTR